MLAFLSFFLFSCLVLDFNRELKRTKKKKFRSDIKLSRVCYRKQVPWGSVFVCFVGWFCFVFLDFDTCVNWRFCWSSGGSYRKSLVQETKDEARKCGDLDMKISQRPAIPSSFTLRGVHGTVVRKGLEEGSWAPLLSPWKGLEPWSLLLASQYMWGKRPPLPHIFPRIYGATTDSN